MAKEKNKLIDEHVSAPHAKTAVSALMDHALKVAKKREENELLPGKEENVWLVLTVKKTHPERKLKPHRVPLKHPLVDPRETPVCLITKDPQREYKDLLESHNIKFISRVVGIEKLKGKFKPFEARRLLLKENGMFLADDRVIPLLPGLLGKKFFDAKKQPIPVCMTRKDLKAELEHAISSSYMHQNQGTCTSVKIGRVSQTPAQILENLKVALPAIVKKIYGGWENVQSFNIKTTSSASLPIWSCALGEGADARWSEAKADAVDEAVGGDWTGFGGAEEEDGESGSDSEGEAVRQSPSPALSRPTSAYGKKRGVEDERGTPNKKTKIAASLDTEKHAEKGSKRKGDPAGSSKANGAPSSKTIKKASATSKQLPAPKLRDTSGETADRPASSKKQKVKAPVPSANVAADTTLPSPISNGKQKKVKESKSIPSLPSLTPTSKPTSASVNMPTTSFIKAVSLVTPKDIKEKRSASGLERKKVKFAKGSIGAAKESILGKKAKARV